LPKTSFVKGKSSGASGFAVAAGGNSTTINLSQTSGTFNVGEQLIVNGIDFSRTIKSVRAYSTDDIKSVQQNASTGFSQFTADCVLEKFGFPNGVSELTISGSNTVTSAGKNFVGIKVGSIIRYQTTLSQNFFQVILNDGSISGLGVTVPANFSTFNRVTEISPDGRTLTIAPTPGVAGVYDGAITNGKYTDVSIGAPFIRSQNSGLYAQLPDSNIASVNLSDSLLKLSQQITGQSTNTQGVLTFNISAISGISSAFFEAFDQERYSIHYSNGGIGTVTSDQFVLSGNTITISGLTPNQTNNVVVNSTIVKNGIQSKIKTYNKSQTLIVDKSKYH
jgi:hypothetical protein